jgi:putative membrane protein
LVAASLAVFNLLEQAWAPQLLGALLLVAGGVATLGGYLRFRGVERAIRSGEPLPVNQTAHLLALAVVICLVAAALSVVIGA